MCEVEGGFGGEKKKIICIFKSIDVLQKNNKKWCFLLFIHYIFIIMSSSFPLINQSNYYLYLTNAYERTTRS